MLGGADPTTGTGGTWTITVAGSWAEGTKFTVILTNGVTGESINVGGGFVTGKVPIFALTYNKKLNLLYSTTWAFSAVNEPTIFNDLNSLGSGNIELSDAYSEADTTQAIVPYQGRVAIFGKNHIQIWQIDADPANYQLTQVLENIGTIAKLSAKALGELDTFFLHRTGFRSLRVKDSSLNATMVDVGSPIDSIVQAQLAASTSIQQAAACGIIEPTLGQYWCFIKDIIYVLSYFPNNKISAWSKWAATYESGGVQTAFVPEKFVSYNGQVFVSTANEFLVYGGADGTTYDNNVCTWETAWLDADSPANEKQTEGIDLALAGSWTISASADYISETMTTVLTTQTAATFLGGKVDFSSIGTHVKLKGVSTASARATISNALIHYRQTKQK